MTGTLNQLITAVIVTILLLAVHITYRYSENNNAPDVSVTNDVNAQIKIKCSQVPSTLLDIGKWNINFQNIEDYRQV